MSDTFNFQRFSKFLKYDISRVYSNYGITLLIFICFPVLLYAFNLILGLMSFSGWNAPSQTMRLGVFFLMTMLLILFFPKNAFGYVTDKKKGSEFLLIPASTFEKFLSMLVISIIILPIIYLIGYVLVDYLLSLIDGSQSESILSLFNSKKFDSSLDFEVFTPAWFGIPMIYSTFVLNILATTLGAIFFKHNKVVKTIIAIVVLSTLASVLFMTLFYIICGTHNFALISDKINQYLANQTDKSLEFNVNLIINIVNTIEFIIFASLIYLRLKTLKH